MCVCVAKQPPNISELFIMIIIIGVLLGNYGNYKWFSVYISLDIYYIANGDNFRARAGLRVGWVGSDSG